MDGAKLVLIGLPVYLFCLDIQSIFTPPSPSLSTHMRHDPRTSLYQPPILLVQDQRLRFASQKTSGVGLGIGVGSATNITFCSVCSYRGNALRMKTMLEAAFPGIKILANHPPPRLKHLLSKVVPVIQVGIMGIVIAGEQIFPRLGIMTPPSWYQSLRANKFRSMASTWLLGNFILSYLQSSGAFEAYRNGELVFFSKLIEQRFPSEMELRGLVNKRLSNLREVGGTGEGFWC